MNLVDEVSGIKQQFNLVNFIETGTSEGVGCIFWSKRFKRVYSCEVHKKTLKIAKSNIVGYNNIFLYHMDSVKFLRELPANIGNQNSLFFLDAHAPGKYWPLWDEIAAIARFGKKSCIAIHDFDTGCRLLDYDTYKNRTATVENTKNALLKVNPNFHFYVNDYRCSRLPSKELLLNTNFYFPRNCRSCSKYDWSQKESKKKGVLICTPNKLKHTTLIQVHPYQSDGEGI